MLDWASVKKLLKVDMLGSAGTKKLNSPKMPDGAGLGKTYSTQFLRWGWHEKVFLLKMLGKIDIKKLVLTQNVRCGWLC